MKHGREETDPRIMVYVAALRELTRQKESRTISSDEFWAAVEVLDERFADVRDWRGTGGSGTGVKS